MGLEVSGSEYALSVGLMVMTFKSLVDVTTARIRVIYKLSCTSI